MRFAYPWGRIDQLASGELVVTNFEVEIGAMNYGIELDGICGLDFLLQCRAIIDLGKLELTPHPAQEKIA